ncbi:hypothetical protein ElyMa_000989200 [Elysia marginata]|uniref:Uncharacterized protein n=1 Tax=Elysia marginata TaxID=1093978 RepID=A0AAV4HGI5_9GAST|nr:hypothetical protein ElyMa_000989200 [Elysia marginata]
MGRVAAGGKQEWLIRPLDSALNAHAVVFRAVTPTNSYHSLYNTSTLFSSPYPPRASFVASDPTSHTKNSPDAWSRDLFWHQTPDRAPEPCFYLVA